MSHTYQSFGSTSLSDSDQLARQERKISCFSDIVDSEASHIEEPKLIMHTDTPLQECTSDKIKWKAGTETGGCDTTDAVPSRTERNLTKGKLEPPAILNGIEDPDQNGSHNATQQNDSSHLYYLTFGAIFECSSICTKFSILELLSTAVSMGLYVFDVATDISNASFYYYRQHENKTNYFYFIFTTILICVPSLITQAFSYWWERDDQTEIKRNREQPKRSACREFLICLVHLLQIATLFRYARIVYYGLKSRKEEQRTKKGNVKFYVDKWRYEHSDLSLVRLFNSFLESAPQLVLQIYIMLITKQMPFITVLSCVVSWTGLSCAFLRIQRSLRHSQEGKRQISILGSIVLFLYRAFTVLSRVLALALLLDVHILAWFGLFVFHWLLMTVWIVAQGTNFCPSGGKELIYDTVVGFCYNFAYVNVHRNDARSRKYFINNKRRLIFFYVVMFAENCVLAGLWLKYRQGDGSQINALMGYACEGNPSTPGLPTDTALVISSLVPAVFFLGMVFMYIYYKCLHPSVKSFGVKSCCGTAACEAPSPSDPTDLPTNLVQGSGEDRGHSASQQLASGLQRSSSVSLNEVVVEVAGNTILSAEMIQGTCEAESRTVGRST